MREIKFRGKRVEDGAWIEGNLIRNHSDGLYWIEGNSFSPTPVLPDSVGQFTGLKECLGRGSEIFEGDLVKWKEWDEEEHITAIEWDTNMARYVFRFKSGHYKNLSSEYCMVIVGHVLTDSHLLT